MLKTQKLQKDINVQLFPNYMENIIVLDTENASEFLELIAPNKVSADKLKCSLLENRTELDDTWKYDYRPSLYINFDKKILYSNYSEPAYFEDYTPNSWIAKYESFDDQVPKGQKYWLDFDNKNLLY